MEIRALEATDLFSMVDIVNKMGLEKVVECFQKPRVTDLINKDKGTGNFSDAIGYTIGIEMVSLVVSNLPKAKDDIFLFLSDLTNEEKKTIEKLPPVEFVKLIKQLFEREDFQDFLSLLSGFFK